MNLLVAKKKSKSGKSKKKTKVPMTLHCRVKGCGFVTHQGIKGIGKHNRDKHPKRMKARK